MFQRVLWVSLSQVLRSIALVLLPVAFLSLIAWATAGSITGNTSDPIRAAMWVWLGLHNIPFSLIIPPAGAEGFLSYLPLGGLLFPFLGIRSSFSKVVDRLDRDTNLINIARLHFTIIYSLIAQLLIFASKSEPTREPTPDFKPEPIRDMTPEPTPEPTPEKKSYTMYVIIFILLLLSVGGYIVFGKK